MQRAPSGGKKMIETVINNEARHQESGGGHRRRRNRNRKVLCEETQIRLSVVDGEYVYQYIMTTGVGASDSSLP